VLEIIEKEKLKDGIPVMGWFLHCQPCMIRFNSSRLRTLRMQSIAPMGSFRSLNRPFLLVHH
jgi:hypothetical protein